MGPDTPVLPGVVECHAHREVNLGRLFRSTEGRGLLPLSSRHILPWRGYLAWGVDSPDNVLLYCVVSDGVEPPSPGFQPGAVPRLLQDLGEIFSLRLCSFILSSSLPSVKGDEKVFPRLLYQGDPGGSTILQCSRV